MNEQNTPSEASAELARVVELLDRANVSGLTATGAHIDRADGITLADCYYSGDRDGQRVAEAITAAVNFLRKHGASLLSSHGVGGEAVAWQEGYRAGVNDERMSEANIGIAGYNAKIEPARENPYRTTPQPRAEGMVLETPAQFAERVIADWNRVMKLGALGWSNDYWRGFREAIEKFQKGLRNAALSAAPSEGSASQSIAAKLVNKADGGGGRTTSFIRPTSLGVDLPPGEYPLYLGAGDAECKHEWIVDPDMGEGSGYLYCRQCKVTRRSPKTDHTPPPASQSATPSDESAERGNPNMCPRCKSWPIDDATCSHCGLEKPFHTPGAST